MKTMRFRPVVFGSVLCMALLSYNLPGFQDPYKTKPKLDHFKHKASYADKDKGTNLDAGKVTMTATLVDAEAKAQKKAATVKVTVTGAKMTDPALVKEQPRAGQAHLHYQVDNGPVIATTSTKLSFHELTPGTHKIVVVLAANDHSPLGPPETLTVRVP